MVKYVRLLLSEEDLTSGSGTRLDHSELLCGRGFIMIKDLNQIPQDYTVEVKNRFKGLDLIDREPDELWMEVHDIVQETGIKTIPMEKKHKKAKWLSEEALQIAVKRRKAKSKGEEKRQSHLNAEFQRIAKRDDKYFLRDQ